MTKYPRKEYCADCNKPMLVEMMCLILVGAHGGKLVCEPCMMRLQPPTS